MFEKIKKWWNRSGDLDNSGIFTKQTPQHRPSNTLTERKHSNVSEPVLSFIQLVKENPSRFLYKCEIDVNIGVSLKHLHKIYDKKTKKLFKIQRKKIDLPQEEIDYYPMTDNISFLTQDEMKYIDDNLIIWNENKDRQINLLNKNLSDMNKRNALIDVYCKENL